MSECRHGTDLNEFDCMNCDRDSEEFERWWENESGYRVKGTDEYNLAKDAWFRAIKYIVDDML